MVKEFKNLAYELYQFRRRVVFASGLVTLCFVILLARLLWLQVVQHNDYLTRAENNRTSIVPAIPNRGLIYDRNGVILADNYSAYTLEITPSRVTGSVDALIDELATVVEITPRDRRRFRKIWEDEKTLGSFPIRTRLSDEEIARFSARSYLFPAVEVQARLFRRYPNGSLAAHLIGYIGRVSQKDVQQMPLGREAENYRGTEYIGKEGIEKSYESYLHGTTGEQRIEISADGRPVRVMSQTSPLPGQNLYLSIDIQLQKEIEKSFEGRKGAMVALDPRNGEVLAYVSLPSFDPNAFIDGIEQQIWDELNNSPDHPLLNRPIMGTYPPGSTYKPFMALAALDTGARAPAQTFFDPGYYMFGGHKFRDSNPKGRGRVNLYDSIVHSSDTYYYGLANDLGVDVIFKHMRKFGFGAPSGIDLIGEKSGTLPSTQWKRLSYKRPEQKKWFPGETISLGIGQGYNAFTPMQMVHALSIILNDGRVFRPHIVRESEDSLSQQKRLFAAREEVPVGIRKEHFEFVKDAMVGVTKQGTSARIFANSPYVSGGKTGTAQVISIKQNEKYDIRKVAKKFQDHSWYIGFAPAQAPQIALAVIVENGGFGAEAAAPIARTAFDYVLRSTLKTSTNLDASSKNSDTTAPMLAKLPAPLIQAGERPSP